MTSLTISVWNIEGLNSSAFGLKTPNNTFHKQIKILDIILLLRRLGGSYHRVQTAPTQHNRHSKHWNATFGWKEENPYYLHGRTESSVSYTFHLSVSIPLWRHVRRVRDRDMPFPGQGNVLVCRDLNTGTGTQPDTINTHFNNTTILTGRSSPSHTNNYDDTINNYGKDVPQVCTSSPPGYEDTLQEDTHCAHLVGIVQGITS